MPIRGCVVCGCCCEFFSWRHPNESGAPPCAKAKCLGSGGSMIARLKLKGIDGRAPSGVEPAAQFDSTRGNLAGQDKVRIDRLKALS